MVTSGSASAGDRHVHDHPVVERLDARLHRHPPAHVHARARRDRRRWARGSRRAGTPRPVRRGGARATPASTRPPATGGAFPGARRRRRPRCSRTRRARTAARRRLPPPLHHSGPSPVCSQRSQCRPESRKLLPQSSSSAWNDAQLAVGVDLEARLLDAAPGAAVHAREPGAAGDLPALVVRVVVGAQVEVGRDA